MKTCVIIAGPTASGKTALSVQLAKTFSTEILSADSRQCYKELNIGVAKPGLDELQAVPHHFINSHSIQEIVNASVYESYALEVVNATLETHEYLIVTGGTGLYIKALTDGLDPIPVIPAAIQETLRKEVAEYGLDWLQKQVQLYDPQYYQSGEVQNPRRLMRALEVMRATGNSIRTYQQAQPKSRPFRYFKFALNWPREQLYTRINSRVDSMMEQGLLEEATALYQYKHLPALATVGYQELFDYIDGSSTLAAAVEKIKQHTRQYAKRQLTWFQKDKEIIWLPLGFEYEFIAEFLGKNTQIH